MFSPDTALLMALLDRWPQFSGFGWADLSALGANLDQVDPTSPSRGDQATPQDPEDLKDRDPRSLPWAFSNLFDLNQIGSQLGLQRASTPEAPVPPQESASKLQQDSVSMVDRLPFTGLFDFNALGAQLGVQTSLPQAGSPIPAQDGGHVQDHTASLAPLEDHGEVFEKSAFSGLFSAEPTQEEPVDVLEEGVHLSDGIHILEESHPPEGDEPTMQDDLERPRARIVRPQTELNEDVMDAHAVASWEPGGDDALAELGNGQLESHRLNMTREDLLSHWAPFSSYFHPGMKVTIDPPAKPVVVTEAKTQTPEGFLVLSVQHHESVADSTDISVGRYFYFDASPFSSFEFSPYPSFVEQWRHGQLLWSGQVQLSLGAYGSADLAEVASPAAGRKGREESKPGDFEVGDIIFVVGFHRDLASADGQYLDFSGNLHFYQASCVGSMLPFKHASTKYVDDLADLGQRIPLGIEVDEQELAAVRPRVTAPPAPIPKASVISTIMKSGSHTTDLSGEGNLAIIPDIPSEGGAGKINSSTSWAARRKEFLEVGLKSLERRAEEALDI